MKIVFIGGVQFSYSILEHILENNWKISTIFCYNETKKRFYSDYKNFDNLSEKYNVPLIKVDKINDKENIEILQQINPDLILVMGWSQLLSPKLISIPKLGVIGSHPTELPKYRGRAPIPWTILKGLKESALSFFYIDEGVDNGDILDQQKFFINENDDATSVYQKIILIGKSMIIKDLELLKRGKASRIKQDERKFLEYWPKRTPKDGLIDWNSNSKEIQTLIRASTHPYPGAFTFFKNSKVIIWKSEIVNVSNSRNSGTILNVSNEGILVGTCDKKLLLKKISVNYKTYDDPSNFFSENDVGSSFEM